MKSGMVIWITGLSGSGKSSLAKEIMDRLEGNKILLDGDGMRYALKLTDVGYDKEGRKKIASVYSGLCKLIAEQGVTVVCSTISMYHEVREWNRKNLPNYYEIFLDIPENIRRNRDPKNLYKDNTVGKVENLAGVDFDVELPLNPDIRFDEFFSLTSMADIVCEKIRTKNNVVH